MKKRKKIFYGILLVLTILRIGLMVKLPFWAIGNSKYDDYLLLNYMENIYNGQWLGAYSNVTLVKGISFSIFTLLCKYLKISYSLGLSLFYIFAAIIFVLAIKRNIKNEKVLGLCYIFLIYSPTGFSLRLAQRIYRMALIYPAVLLTVAFIIGLYFRKDDEIKDLILWAIGSGLSFSFFWFIREDSIWLAPFFICGLLITAIYYWAFMKARFKEKAIRTSILIIPICIFLLSYNAICMMNYKYYGVYTTNDRTDTSFADLVGNILKIKSEDKGSDVWATRETMEKVIDVSPTLSTIEELIIRYHDAWSVGGEVKGDLFTWAMRGAVQEAGYYDTAYHAEEFYKKVNDEVEEAFNNGKLQKKDAIYFSSQSKGIKAKELPYFIKKTFTNLFELALYDYSDAQIITNADGTDEEVRYMESLTWVQAMYPTRYVYDLSGYIFAKNDYDILNADIIDEAGNLVETLTLKGNEEVKNKYQDYRNAENSYFNTKLTNRHNHSYKINVYINGELINEGEIKSDDNELYVLNIDKSQYTECRDAHIDASSDVIKTSNNIIDLYKYSALPLIIMSIISYLFILFRVITKRDNSALFEFWLILTGIIASAFILEFGVTVFSDWLEFNDFYSAGVYPLIQVFEFLCIYLAIKEIKNINRKSNQYVENIK